MIRSIRTVTLLLSVIALLVPIGALADDDDDDAALQTLQTQIDDLQAQINALSGLVAEPISIGEANVFRLTDFDCPGQIVTFGGIVVASDGSATVPDSVGYAAPDPMFGDLASISTGPWMDVEGRGRTEFVPAGCFGLGDPGSDTLTEDLFGCAVAADGTVACVDGRFCSGDCPTPGFSGTPWTFEGDATP